MMTINLRRIIFLIRNDIRTKGRLYLLIIAVSFSVLIYFFFNSSSEFLLTAGSLWGTNSSGNFQGIGFSNVGFKYHLKWFPNAFLIITSILTSISFSELGNKNSRHFHLSIPASIIEKWTSKVVLSVILLPLLILVLYYIFTLFTYRWDEQQVRLGIADSFLWKHIKYGVLSQCLVLLGALIFRKFSLLKIILCGIVIYISYNVIQVIAFVVMNEGIDLFKNGGTLGLNSLHTILGKAGYYSTTTNSVSDFVGTSDLGLLTILALIALVVSFVKYRELES